MNYKILQYYLMKITYNSQNFEEIILENIDNQSYPIEYKNCYRYYNPIIGKGLHYHGNTNNIGVVYHTIQCKEDSLFIQEVEKEYFSFGFFLSGLVYHSLGKKIRDNKVDGKMISMALIPPETIWKFKISSSKELVYGRIYMTPDLIRNMIIGAEDDLPELFRGIIENEKFDLLYKNIGFNLNCVPIFKEIIECNFHGLTRQLFMESKILGLMVNCFEAYKFNVKEEKSKIKLSQSDLLKIYEVENLIVNNMDVCYTITRLSNEVGLNTFKLKYGFKKIFGFPIFRYIHNCRMTKALEVLRETDANISDVAYSVGYQTIGAFSNAFYERYGVRPTDIKKMRT
jgi:AraC-like DNA-binding protein